MRIGMIMDTPFPPDARVENETKTLIEMGFEVFLYHIDYENRPVREDYEGVRIIRQVGSRLLYKFSALAYTVPFFRWMVESSIRNFIRETKVDVLHIHDMVIAEAVFSANKAFQLPVILDLHENRPAIMKMYKHVQQWPGRWLISLDRWKQKQRELMRKADHVILVTEEARQLALEEDGIEMGKTTAVPNVVRLDRFNISAVDTVISQMTEGKFTLLYIGDTSIRRGTMTALATVDILMQQIPELQLLLVGNSSQDNLLQNFVQNRKLENWVRFEGWQQPDRLPAYINASDICLSPLLRNAHHDTTYANKLFQYMAVGKPVVVSDCTAQAEVIRREQCGLIHPAGDAEALAKAVLELYRDPGKRGEMGRNGLKAVQEHWNWKETGKALLKIYEKVKVAEG